MNFALHVFKIVIVAFSHGCLLQGDLEATSSSSATTRDPVQGQRAGSSLGQALTADWGVSTQGRQQFGQAVPHGARRPAHVGPGLSDRASRAPRTPGPSADKR